MYEKQPFISIIIPTLNEAENIGALLRHLQYNTTKAVRQIIVTDGGSTDDTLAIARSLGATAVKSPARGRAAQMNYAAAMAEGEVFYFVHADTVPPLTFVGDITEAINDGYDLGRYKTKFLGTKPLLRINEWATSFDFFVCMGGDQTLFIKKELFTQVGGFKEDMILMEEYELCKAAREIGRYKIMNGRALISARKYDKNSWLQVQRANYKVVKLYKSGASQEEMAGTYKKMLKW